LDWSPTATSLSKKPTLKRPGFPHVPVIEDALSGQPENSSETTVLKVLQDGKIFSIQPSDVLSSTDLKIAAFSPFRASQRI
jgi:hypothetical protein